MKKPTKYLILLVPFITLYLCFYIGSLFITHDWVLRWYEFPTIVILAFFWVASLGFTVYFFEKLYKKTR